MGVGLGVQNLCPSVCQTAMSDCANRTEVGVSLVVLESASANLLAADHSLALLRKGFRVGIWMSRSTTTPNAVMQNAW